MRKRIERAYTGMCLRIAFFDRGTNRTRLQHGFSLPNDKLYAAGAISTCREATQKTTTCFCLNLLMPGFHCVTNSHTQTVEMIDRIEVI